MSLSALLILILATWRLSSLLVDERGPLDVFVRIRELAGIQHDESKKPFLYPERFFAQLLSCIWCISIWVAGGWSLAYYLVGDAVILLALPFALSAGAIILSRYHV